MRQHVNPLSKHYKIFKKIPPLKTIFKNPQLPLHIDVGCGAGNFIFELAIQNQDWNYLGIEIREKLVLNAKSKCTDLYNLDFFYGNADYLIQEFIADFPEKSLSSISFYFPDPWFKKKHHKRRIIQPELIKQFS